MHDWKCSFCQCEQAECEGCGRRILGRDKPAPYRKGIITNAVKAELLIAVNNRLFEFGYNMCVPDDTLTIGTLPTGAIIVTSPNKKPITILINNIDHIPDNIEPHVS